MLLAVLLPETQQRTGDALLRSGGTEPMDCCPGLLQLFSGELEHFQGDARLLLQQFLEVRLHDAQQAAFRVRLGSIEMTGVTDRSQATDQVAGTRETEQDVLAVSTVLQQLHLTGSDDEHLPGFVPRMPDPVARAVMHLLEPAVDLRQFRFTQVAEELRLAEQFEAPLGRAVRKFGTDFTERTGTPGRSCRHA